MSEIQASEPMREFDRTAFTAPINDGHQVTHDIYSRGDGPVIVIVQELPGIGTATLDLARHFVDQGFSVCLPHLFGPLGRTSMLGNMARVMCLRREFKLLEKNATSPIVDWLRALCVHLAETQGVPGVGVIGMCLTGNFAISLMADESVLAGVASQPSMPFFDQSSLHMSQEDVREVRAALDEPMLAYRFEGDPICTAEKFEALNSAFNDDRERIRLVTLPGKGHSVLTLDFVDEAGHPTRQALDDVTDYFRASLTASTD